MSEWRPEPACIECGDSGEIFTHADDCADDFCALAGGYNDCSGKVEPCPYCTTEPPD